MRRLFIMRLTRGGPRRTYHKTRARFSIVRARNGNGGSPGWHFWFYTYPDGVQHARAFAIYGRWVAA